MSVKKEILAVVESVSGKRKEIIADVSSRFDVIKRRDGFLTVRVIDRFEEVYETHNFVVSNTVSWCIESHNPHRPLVSGEYDDSTVEVQKVHGFSDLHSGYSFFVKCLDEQLIVHEVNPDSRKVKSTIYVLKNIEGWQVKNFHDIEE